MPIDKYFLFFERNYFNQEYEELIGCLFVKNLNIASFGVLFISTKLMQLINNKNEIKKND